MKTKLLIATLVTLLLGACSEDIPNYPLGPDDFNKGIEYKYGDSWEYAHDKPIDISGQPNDFTLEFRTLGLQTIVMHDSYKAVHCTILDTLSIDPETGKILNKPIYNNEPYLYMQRVHFETNGEKLIKANFYYSGAESGTSRIILTRE
ncbi:MAG: hypothetical protein J6J93_10880 [Muribaculaceae bacterium]|nr:hypothetical protein [Muribaculaceae bacterium]